MIVLPIVHLNGTSRKSLIEQRCQAGLKIGEALEALCNMAPHGRDYYLKPGLFEQAMAQYERRAEMLRDLLTEIEQEMNAIADHLDRIELAEPAEPNGWGANRLELSIQEEND